MKTILCNFYIIVFPVFKCHLCMFGLSMEVFTPTSRWLLNKKQPTARNCCKKNLIHWSMSTSQNFLFLALNDVLPTDINIVKTIKKFVLTSSCCNSKKKGKYT